MTKNLAPVAALLALTLPLTARLAAAETSIPDPKSRTTAIRMSIAGTLASGGLVLAGAALNNQVIVGAGFLSSLVTPSAGAWYAGKPLTVGMGIRAVSAVSAVVGLNEAFKCFLAEDTCHRNDVLAGTLLGAGVLGYASGIVYDIATAGTAVDAYNQRFHLRMSPAVVSTSAGPTVGLGLDGTF